MRPVIFLLARRVPCFAALLALTLLLVSPSRVAAQQAEIGIYNDESRSSCSLSDAGSGLISAYVVVNAPNGMTGVRFSIPKPECFNAVWTGEFSDYTSIGNSQNDVSIGIGGCRQGLTHVLTVLYQKTSSTGPCCELQIKAAEGQADVQFTDCGFELRAIAPRSGFINADASCACAGSSNLAPSVPTNPLPFSGAGNVRTDVSLTWEASDPEQDALHYDLYLGTSPNPPLVASNLTVASYAPPSLAERTLYSWKVVAFDSANHSTEGPVWTFTTTMPVFPPGPTDPSPADDAASQNRELILAWSSSAFPPPLSYEIHFGTTMTPPAVATVPAQSRTSYPVDSLALDTRYYWSVVSIGGGGQRTEGPMWTFKTWTTNPAPSTPDNPQPANQMKHVPTAMTLSWVASDPESQALHYDVYFGATSDPAFLAHATTNHFDVTGLDYFKDYYWRVVVFDSEGASTSGPTWTFRTKGDKPPTMPVLVSPALESVVSPFSGHLEWSAQDPEGDPLVFKVYLGTTADPPLVLSSANHRVDFIDLNLSGSTTYYWRVSARDSDDLVTDGPLWTFQTKALIPPNPPSDPSPVDGATNLHRLPKLKWHASDPDNQVLRYVVWLGTSQSEGQDYQAENDSLQVQSPLDVGTQYYWRVTAIDTDNSSTVGPWWTFTTSTSNLPPTAPASPDPADHATGQSSTVMLQWSATDPEGLPLTYTVCFGSTPNPPQIASHWPKNSYTIYDLPEKDWYWVIVAHDVDGNSTFGPRWTFHVGGACASCEPAGSLSFAQTEDSCGAGVPHRMTVALDLSTAIVTDNASVDVVIDPSLQFITCERGDLTQNWTTFNEELNGNVLSLSASGGLIPAGVTGSFALLTFETNCCEWTSPPELGLTDPLGDFQSTRLVKAFLDCRYPANGDVNNDGNLTLADAQCALESYLYWPISSPGGCGRPGASWRADVNCSETPTPGDAGCIYRELVDHACTFCNGDVHPSPVTAPRLELRSIVENQDVVIVLSSSVTSSMNSLGFELTYPDELQFLRVEAPGNDKFAALQWHVVEPGRLRIGGYANSGTALPGDGDLIAIRFRARAGRLHASVTALQFVDDLAGASNVSTSMETAISTPVPDQVVLHQNSPNPFNPETTIRFELPSATKAQLSIFDVHGRLVRKLIDEQRGAGASTVEWNGRDDRGAGVATGVYFYVLEAAGSRYQRKMVLLK